MNILNTIGNTPLVKIERISRNPKVNIFAKLEGFNPTGSIKDRIALAMVEKAEREGLLTKDKTIIEATSGNTGIALAMIGAVKGYKVKVVMPESMSIERRKVIKSFGAEIILVKDEEWRDAAITFTKGLAEKDSSLVMLNQYENEANIIIHYNTTGKEIIEQMEKPDVFIAGIGTGGTITGIGKRLKKEYPSIKIIGAEVRPGSKIQGLKSLKEGYVPPVLDMGIIEEKILIEDEDAFRTTRELAEKEGVFVGPSSGAVMYIALKESENMEEGNIAVIFPDRGEKYLSIDLF